MFAASYHVTGELLRKPIDYCSIDFVKSNGYKCESIRTIFACNCTYELNLLLTPKVVRWSSFIAVCHRRGSSGTTKQNKNKKQKIEKNVDISAKVLE